MINAEKEEDRLEWDGEGKAGFGEEGRKKK